MVVISIRWPVTEIPDAAGTERLRYSRDRAALYPARFKIFIV